MVSESETAAIKEAFEAGGEFDAMLKLREFFPGVGPDEARECVRTIASWGPLPERPTIRRAGRRVR